MNPLIVYKKSVYELYKDSPDPEVRAYAQENEIKLKKGSEEQKRTLETITSAVQHLGMSYKELYRAELQNLSPEDFAKHDLIISVGGDGTFLEVSHYLHQADVPLLGVNSDPNSSVGFFCSAYRENFAEILENIGTLPRTQLPRLQLIRNDISLPELVLNDVLFAHHNPASNTRFVLEVSKEPISNQEKKDISNEDNKEKKNKKEKEFEPSISYRGSNGILACTSSGSTAWMYQLGEEPFDFSCSLLKYRVRDARGEQGRFAQELKITSQTREGKIWIDGAHLSYDLGLGGVLEIQPGTPLLVVGDLQEKRKKWLKKQKAKETKEVKL
ncbi:NAD(+)/NADH kinase [Candidatus Woesearchaeota archaeon]|nr:NAD(+)/NADH kinase [Candidatus Woesearchaeota archaeon]